MIKKLLLLILVSFGMATEWGASASVRTPNDNIHPLDYEFSIKLEDTNGKFQYLLKRDWERELGTKYIDDNAWFIIKYNEFYFKPEYMNKESKNIEYIKVDWRYAWKDLTVGWTTRTLDTNFSDFSTFFEDIGEYKKGGLVPHKGESFSEVLSKLPDAGGS